MRWVNKTARRCGHKCSGRFESIRSALLVVAVQVVELKCWLFSRLADYLTACFQVLVVLANSQSFRLLWTLPYLDLFDWHLNNPEKKRKHQEKFACFFIYRTRNTKCVCVDRFAQDNIGSVKFIWVLLLKRPVGQTYLVSFRLDYRCHLLVCFGFGVFWLRAASSHKNCALLWLIVLTFAL